MTKKLRKQLVFKNEDYIKTIEQAVAKINKESKNGESISVNRFMTQKSYEAALQVLKRKK